MKNAILHKYNICEATLRNWIKLGYIDSIDNISEQDIEKIILGKRNSRKNKKQSLSTIIPISYVESQQTIDLVENILLQKTIFKIDSDTVMNLVIKKLISEKNNNEIRNEIEALFPIKCDNSDFLKFVQDIDFQYDIRDDFLGFLYMSMLSIGEKDKNGIFYTPSEVVDITISKITNINKVGNFLDPACGSGNFLIKLFSKLLKNGENEAKIIDSIHGFDIDKKAVFISKINIYILTKNTKFNEIKIYEQNFLNLDNTVKFDVIIGNPPWGVKYSKRERENLANRFGKEFSSQDSFSHFIHESINLLNTDGQLLFVLPSSILNIAKHEFIRKYILGKNIISIDCVGRKFSEIVTDVIILKIANTTNIDNHLYYNSVKVSQSHFYKNPYTNFLISDNYASSIIKKIKGKSSFYLNDNSIIYALGIVTGNNEDLLESEPQEGFEPIISGKNIKKYVIDYSEVNNYILFKKENLQQVADEALYRHKKKILYKFIGKKLAFALEPKGMLSLNSANVICLPNNINEYQVIAVLNSRVTQLFFDELYNTSKVLKNHIQSFPIFNLDNNEINDIIKSIKSQKNIEKFQYIEMVEEIIYKHLNLDEKEINYIKERYI